MEGGTDREGAYPSLAPTGRLLSAAETPQGRKTGKGCVCVRGIARAPPRPPLPHPDRIDSPQRAPLLPVPNMRLVCAAPPGAVPLLTSRRTTTNPRNVSGVSSWHIRSRAKRKSYYLVTRCGKTRHVTRPVTVWATDSILLATKGTVYKEAKGGMTPAPCATDTGPEVEEAEKRGGAPARPTPRTRGRQTDRQRRGRTRVCCCACRVVVGRRRLRWCGRWPSVVLAPRAVRCCESLELENAQQSENVVVAKEQEEGTRRPLGVADPTCLLQPRPGPAPTRTYAQHRRVCGVCVWVCGRGCAERLWS